MLRALRAPDRGGRGRQNLTIMLNEQLHRQPVALDRIQHRTLKLDAAQRDLTPMRGLNAFFVASTEFADACRDYPVVWVKAGTGDDGVPQIAPIAVLGLKAGQNLCLDGDVWRTRYVPAALRLYPFALARVSPEQVVVVIEPDYPGFNAQIGEALFDEQGEPSAFTRDIQQQLELFEQEVERTRLVGRLLLDKGLLRDMRFDATLPGGEQLSVDGFLTIDADKLRALPEADVMLLHRNGVLGLIHAHQVSLGNMTKLAEWHLARSAS
ncbi:MAG: hypothetical protein RLY78_642 [Pseudomonadota bacterium]|jgi:hypothetical protein|uniref:SapC family protein n=1 Tax=Pseudaquabacterium rugosum TaxID=2984194 RepID=A0ABU9B6M8_9BURK